MAKKDEPIVDDRQLDLLTVAPLEKPKEEFIVKPKVVVKTDGKIPTVIGKNIVIDDKQYIVLRVYCIGHVLFKTVPHYVFSTWEEIKDGWQYDITTTYAGKKLGQLYYKHVPEFEGIERFKKEKEDHTYLAIEMASELAKTGVRKKAYVYVDLPIKEDIKSDEKHTEECKSD